MGIDNGRECSLNMRGHIVGAFRGMRVERILLLDQTIQPRLQISLGRRICILLNEKTGRSMLHKNVANPLSCPRFANNRLYLRRDFVKALVRGVNGDAFDHEVVGKRTAPATLQHGKALKRPVVTSKVVPKGGVPGSGSRAVRRAGSIDRRPSVQKPARREDKV